MRLASLALMVLLTQTTAAQAFADPPGFKSLAIGDRAPDFELPGVDDRPYSLKSFADSRLLLVVFTCNHCPTAQAYESRIMKLHADYKDRGVALVAISPNDDLNYSHSTGKDGKELWVTYASFPLSLAGSKSAMVVSSSCWRIRKPSNLWNSI